jgi:flagellar hook-associated protein 2
MPQINLGNGISQVNGRTVLNGISSGLDTKALMEADEKRNEQPLTAQEEKLKLTANQITAFQRMKTLLQNVQDKVKALRNPPSILDACDNVFNMRQVQGVTNEAVEWDKFIEIEAESGATINQYKINIEQLAEAKDEQFGASNDPLSLDLEHQIGFPSRIDPIVKTSPAAGQFKAGIFKINNEEVTLDNDDTLEAIRAKINYLSSQTKVKAEIIKKADSDFRLNLISADTGIINAFTIDDSVNNVFANIDRVVAKDAKNAKLKINDNAIERPTNKIEDFVDKIKFKLLNINTDPTKQITVNLCHNSKLIRESIFHFVIAYNDFRQFVAKQQERDSDGKYTEFAFLREDATFRNIYSSLQDSIRYNVAGIDLSQLHSLKSIGISFYTTPANPQDGTIEASDSLEIKESILDSKIKSSIEEVEKLFKFDFIALSNKIVPMERTFPLKQNNFTLKIKTDGLTTPYATSEKVAITYKDSNGQDVIEYADFVTKETGSNNLRGAIKGRPNTILEGFNLMYLGNPALAIDTIDISLTQGLADKAFIILNSVTKYEGVINQNIKRMQDQIRLKKVDIEKMEARLKALTDRKNGKYTNLESIVAGANQTMQYMDAFTSANNKR